jgi:hypothetical protein
MKRRGAPVCAPKHVEGEHVGAHPNMRAPKYVEGEHTVSPLRVH